MGQAGGLKLFPLLLFARGIALVVDLQGLLLYNKSCRRSCFTIVTMQNGEATDQNVGGDIYGGSSSSTSCCKGW